VSFVIGSLRAGGAERQLLELVRGLDRARFLPSVITFRPGPGDAETTCERIQLTGEKIHTAFLPIEAAFCLGRLVRELRRLRPQIVHAFLPEFSTLFGSLGAQLARVPIFVAGRRSSAALYRQSRWLTAAERVALRHADFMLSNSGAIAKEIVDLDGFPHERVATIPNGVDATRFRPELTSALRPRCGWSERHFVIGMVANFRACKRHDDFLHAAALLHRQHPETRFVLVGNDLGKLEPSRARIRELRLGQAVQIITGCSKPETIYPALDVYVCTSETEGLSNALLEAMACGKPLVATAVGGNPELIQPDVQGILIPPYRPDAAVAALQRLIINPELRHRLGAAGRLRVERHYSLAAMVRAHEQLYTRLIAEKLHPQSFVVETCREFPAS
jgi:glycosyltransferase involved in cell wall biosynthesis